MESNKPSSGSVSAGDNQQPSLWRPWNQTEGEPQRTVRFESEHNAPEVTLKVETTEMCLNFQAPSLHADLYAQPKTQQVLHPVKLFWPKSRCFDYLYRDAEMLLRSYPIQATICPYEDSSIDEESEDEEEEAELKLEN